MTYLNFYDKMEFLLQRFKSEYFSTLFKSEFLASCVALKSQYLCQNLLESSSRSLISKYGFFLFSYLIQTNNNNNNNNSFLRTH
jgi:hypothetical protein